MATYEKLSSSTGLAKIALLIITIGMVFNYVAFCTTGWGIAHVSDNDDYHTGLWKRCRSITKGCDSLDGYAKVWFGAVQGFACIGFAGVNLTFALTFAYLFIDKCHRDREVALAAGFVGLVTSGCWFIAIVIFGVEYEDDDDVSATVTPYGDSLAYSFICAVFACAFDAVAGGFMMVECFYKRGKKYSDKHTHHGVPNY